MGGFSLGEWARTLCYMLKKLTINNDGGKIEGKLTGYRSIIEVTLTNTWQLGKSLGGTY